MLALEQENLAVKDTHLLAGICTFFVVEMRIVEGVAGVAVNDVVVMLLPTNCTVLINKNHNSSPKIPFFIVVEILQQC